jgi:hypothetical protein
MVSVRPDNGDRVKRTDTGLHATFVSHYKDGGFEVLLDTGAKIASTWEAGTPIEVVARPDACPRCGGPHRAFDCTGGPDE